MFTLKCSSEILGKYRLKFKPFSNLQVPDNLFLFLFFSQISTPSASRWDETPGRPKGSETPGVTPHRPGSETPGATPSTRIWESTPGHVTPGHATPSATPGGN